MTIRRSVRLTRIGLMIATAGVSTFGGTPLPAPLAVGAADCASLAALALPQGRVSAATQVEAGTFTPPAVTANENASRAFKALPAFCRVAATLRPSALMRPWSCAISITAPPWRTWRCSRRISVR